MNGIDVVRRPVGHFGGPWPRGHPTGYLFHYTAGCGSDISDVLEARGISVHFSVDRDGKVYEYVPVSHVAFHAFEASFAYWGVEHNAGRCDHEQLMVSTLWGSKTPIRSLTSGETGYRVERSSDGATGWITIATTGQDHELQRRGAALRHHLLLPGLRRERRW